MSRFSDDAQGLNVIFSSLSLSGYAVTLEGVATTFFLFLGAYIVLEHNIRLLPREKFKFAISMVRQVYTPMVLSRNRLEEIMESGVSAETRRMLETVLKHIEHAIVSSRNIMQLDRGGLESGIRNRDRPSGHLQLCTDGGGPVPTICRFASCTNRSQP